MYHYECAAIYKQCGLYTIDVMDYVRSQISNSRASSQKRGYIFVRMRTLLRMLTMCILS